MDEDGLHPEQLRDLACVLSSCSSKASQSINRICQTNSAHMSRVAITYTCFCNAYPLASVNARIGLHIVSFATLINLCSRSRQH